MKKVLLASLFILSVGGVLLGVLPRNIKMKHDFSLNVLRRKDLLTAVKEEFSSVTNGSIILFAGFEADCSHFRQEPSFFYLTGINEPGAALKMDFDGTVTLYVPNFGGEREKWMAAAVPLTADNAKNIGLDTIKMMGKVGSGYQLHPFSGLDQYEILAGDIQETIKNGGTIFTTCPDRPYGYVEQRWLLGRLEGQSSGLSASLVDISHIIAEMRRKKDMHEIDCLYKAIDITMMAQDAAAQAIGDGISESEVQASLEYVFIASSTRAAFPSIVASGKNTTVLHYNSNNEQMKYGDLIVVDIGAEYGGYSADITRTYPVSGKFTDRQKEIYNIVLATQKHIADIAQPGYWMRNPEQPEKSLHHLAVKFLEEKGYAQYFPHGIGHYLGLDTHDVGDYTKPLAEGDVITIEPGIYISEEHIGIRIEDDYWIVKGGAVCLSEQLLSKPEDIEAMVQQADAGPLVDHSQEVVDN